VIAGEQIPLVIDELPCSPHSARTLKKDRDSRRRRIAREESDRIAALAENLRGWARR